MADWMTGEPAEAVSAHLDSVDAIESGMGQLLSIPVSVPARGGKGLMTSDTELRGRTDAKRAMLGGHPWPLGGVDQGMVTVSG
jgi:hypothetical protein